MKPSNSRRNFLKLTALFASVPLMDNFTARLLYAEEIKTFSPVLKDGEVISAAHWGTLKLEIKNSKLIKSSNAIKTSELPNELQSAMPSLVYAKDRIKYPMVRKSYLKDPTNPKPELRGKDEWVKISYKEAIKLISDELKRTRKKYGSHGIFAGSYGWKSAGNLHNCRILLHRFMNATGGFIGASGDYSTGASQIIMPHVLGSIEVYEQQTSWPMIIEHSKVVVIWGADPLSTLKISWTASDEMGLAYLEKLKKSNKKIICIDPCKTPTAKYLNAQWIAPVPNTDTALMLGLMHELYESKSYDKNFIEEYTVGFDKFLPYLTGKSDGVAKDPAWASKICGIDEKLIKKLAHLFYENPTMLISGWSLQRQDHGEQPHWALVTLACMLGQIGTKGGGFGLSYHYANGGSPTANAAVIGGMNASVTPAKDDKKAAWLKDTAKLSIPVARIADMLLYPGKEIDFNGKKIKYPKIDFIYWVGGNPFVHHQNINNLSKAWQKPRSIVVHDSFWTPTAKMADIVMPINTSYERNDITMTGDYSNKSIVPMKQAIKSLHESVSDFEVFRDLAKAFGVEEVFTEGKDEYAWIRSFYLKAKSSAKALKIDMPSFEEFWSANKAIEFAVPQSAEEYVRYADFREDPMFNPLGTPSGKIEIYSQNIQKMNYDDCKAHPCWFEPIEWLGMKNKKAEFALVSSHPQMRLHSQLNNTSLREKYAVANREPVFINTKDAKNKGIKSGDLVRVFNERGEILAGAVVSDDIRQGVVKVQEGAWWAPQNLAKEERLCTNGCANVLTIDKITSKLACANIAHTALVNIEKYNKKAPKLNIFHEIG